MIRFYIYWLVYFVTNIFTSQLSYCSPTVIQLPNDLPVIAIPSVSNSQSLAVFISGDAGWTSFDQSVGEELAKKGVAVIGIDAQKYFWEKKTPEQTTAAITQVVNHYLKEWKRESFILIGFSFGASISPFIANRFQEPLKTQLKELVVISPDDKGDFEIHISDMLNWNNSKNNYDVIAEIRKVTGIKILCLFNKDEPESNRNKFIIPGIDMITLPGNHHFNNNYQLLATSIINYLKIK